MVLNSDIIKQAQGVIFSSKNTKTDHPIIFLMKHLLLICYVKRLLEIGMHLDEKLNFNTLVNEKISIGNKGIGIIRKLARVLPR